MTVVTWTGIWVTILVTFAEGAIFYAFFLYQRGKDKAAYAKEKDEYNVNNSSGNPENSKRAFDLYEPRQHTRQHRSPPPFQDLWWNESFALDDEETLRCVGLDSFMFLRLLRLGARICFLGSTLSLVLLPIYATGGETGEATEDFNLLTLARVKQGSSWRLYVTVVVWYFFVAAILHEFWKEWELYNKYRTAYLARGDIDMPVEYRYTIRVEQVSNNSDRATKLYFERLFPGKVQQAASCLQTAALEKLIDLRQKFILKLEAVTAKGHAKPNKPRQQIKVKRKKVDAANHYETEIAFLNAEIDAMRSNIFKAAQLKLAPSSSSQSSVTAPIVMNTPSEEETKDQSIEVDVDAVLGFSRSHDADDPSYPDDEVEETEATKFTTSTAFVTFTSLRAKQAAIQCELNGDPDSMVVFPVADPNGTLWKNVTVPLARQNALQFNAALFWMVGIMFWAIPVSFVTSIANLNSILEAIGVSPANPNVFWYGLVSGLLPVIALVILMAVLYMAITASATSFIRYKSWSEVDSYCLYWHMLFQFANLWLILIGGSAFNQMHAILDDPTKLATIIAQSLPGASTFFVNMIVVSSFGAFGLELSMLPAHGVKLIMNVVSPEAARTQRQLDDAKKPPSIVWGKQVPPVIFIFLVVFIYMPIVPIVEIFGLAYFSGMYLVWKHQCLHVYAQEFEGGGDATWQKVFGFLMACLYCGEFVFIAYMGLKEAPIQGGLGFVPLIVTFLVNRILNRKLIVPLRNLSLEAAADVDLQDGELSMDCNSGKQLYRQPALDSEQDERGPMPYRRQATTTTTFIEVKQEGAV